MLKRLILALAISAGLLSPSLASGTIPFSLSQQFDNLGKPLSGCKFYTIQAGTTSTPQNAYQDSALTIPLPNPQTCDSAGRLPQMFLADGQIKVRLVAKNGVNVVTADNIQVVGASGGDGGGGTVDATTVLATGDLKARYGTGVLPGFVRANGRTIGSASSGATERANADCESLFEYLWQVNVNLTVSGGRGVSPNADWVANKTITLPDWRGRALAALDDMGSSAAGRLTLTYFGATATILGASGGSENKTLLTANLPAYTPTGTLSLSTSVSTSVTTGITDPGHVHNVQVPQQGATLGSPISSKFFEGQNTTGATVLNVTSDSATTGISASSSATSTATPTGSFTGAAQGGSSTSFAIASPMMLATFYLKL